MGLDTGHDELLAAATAAGARLAAAEWQADRARTEYHHAVRRLHLAGRTVREVARSIGISHQRVQQIVRAGGGSWWSRVWRGRRVTEGMRCSFCGRPPEEVAKLIAGPRVYICDACVSCAERIFVGDSPSGDAGAGRFASVPPTSRSVCSFCGKKAESDSRLVASGQPRVCRKCLGICRDILDAA
jgi:hypothetical protein